MVKQHNIQNNYIFVLSTSFLFLFLDNHLFSLVCEVPLAPVSGSVSVSADGMTATYMCDLLHTMVGQSTRECLLNGSSWTTSPPKCGTVS